MKDPKTAASKIWERVEKLGQMVAPEPAAAKPETAPAKAKAAQKAKGRARTAKGAPAKAEPTKKAALGEGCAQSQESGEG
ncbi:MAG: hypothetical protein ABSH32_02070 [Bryobacteraceae bacterium]